MGGYLSGGGWGYYLISGDLFSESLVVISYRVINKPDAIASGLFLCKRWRWFSPF
jgi:hypothetical protein